MVSCAIAFDMEKLLQLVYTISKFKEVQDEFTMKVYYDIKSTLEGCFGTTHRKDIVYHDYKEENYIFHLISKGDMWHYLQFHLFEYWIIICKHVISFFICKDITLISNRYILRRWKRDINRAHARVNVKYGGLVSTSR